MLRKVLVALEAAAVALAGLAFIQAAALANSVLPAVVLGGQVTASVFDGPSKVQDVTDPTTGFVTLDPSVTLATTLGVASASGSLNLGPSPGLSANAGVSFFNTNLGPSISSSANLTLNYSVEVVGPAGVIVPLVVTSFGQVSAGRGGDASATMDLSSGTSISILRFITAPSPTSSASFSCCAGVALDATSGVPILVDLNVTASAAVGFSASASIDPIFMIDPSFADADLFSIITSPGIGNSPATTPLPATLPLLLTGLGLLGVLGSRRRRRRS